LWRTKTAEAEALVREHAFVDLAMMLSYTEIAVWRQFLHERPETRVETERRLAALDSHANAAFDRLGPEKTSWLGSAVPAEPAVAAALATVSAEERQMAYLDAALALSFIPVVGRPLDCRTVSADLN
jgi:hypothetical protein